MKKITVAKALVNSLKAEKTEFAFGLIGSSTMELFDALYDNKTIKLIDVHDERTGVHMADGYARASGKAGIIIAGQNGPGATNLVTGLSQAAAAFSPVISIAGALSTEHQYRDAFQEVDQQSLFKPVCKKTWTVYEAKRIQEHIEDAFRVALAPRRGPVQLNIPRNIFSQTIEFSDSAQPQNYRDLCLPSANKQTIQTIIKQLLTAEKIALLLGGGLKNSVNYQSIIKLAEKLNSPMIASAGHGDVMTANHPLYLGQMGPRGNPIATEAMQKADIILALGTRLGFNSTFYSYDNLNAQAKIIQVEIEPTAIGRYFPVTMGVWADALTVIEQLNQELPKHQLIKQAENKVKQWTKTLQNKRKQYLQKRDENIITHPEHIHPSALYASLRKLLPKNSIITLDAGTLCLQATDALNYYESKSLFSPLDFGLIGFSYSCGLGVKLAQPNRPVISLMGDGGFGMTVSEISTAVKFNINTTTVVMNNECWGAEKAYQKDFFSGRYIAADLKNPNFSHLAKLYGAIGFEATTIREFEEALEQSLTTNKPTIIDVKMDPQALYSFRRDSFKHRS